LLPKLKVRISLLINNEEEWENLYVCQDTLFHILCRLTL
jgi:hypothetical protein